MVTPYEAQCLKKFAQRAMGWERPAFITGIGQGTYDSLVKQGYLEERRDGPGASNRWLRLTEKGKRAVDEGLF
jgi:hypothetical protein